MAVAEPADLFGAAILSVTPISWLGIIILSGVAGAVSLLLRFSADKVARVRKAAGLEYKESDILGEGAGAIYSVSHIGGSILAGILTFFSAASYITNGHALVAAVAAAAFGGARGLEKYMGVRVS